MDVAPVKILVVLVIALIVLGPERLPRLARRFGEAWRDLQRLRQQLRSEIDGAVSNLGVAPRGSAGKEDHDSDDGVTEPARQLGRPA